MKFLSSHYEKLVLLLLIAVLGAVSSVYFLKSVEREENFFTGSASSFSIDEFGDQEAVVLLKETQLLPNDSITIFDEDGREAHSPPNRLDQSRGNPQDLSWLNLPNQDGQDSLPLCLVHDKQNIYLKGWGVLHGQSQTYPFLQERGKQKKVHL